MLRVTHWPVHQLSELTAAAATALHLVPIATPFCDVTGVRADYLIEHGVSTRLFSSTTSITTVSSLLCFFEFFSRSLVIFEYI